MLVCVITWALYSTLLKKNKFQFSQFSLIQLMVSAGLLFLIPQLLYEKSIGLEVNFNKAFFYHSFLSCDFSSYSCLLLLAKRCGDNWTKSGFYVYSH